MPQDKKKKYAPGARRRAIERNPGNPEKAERDTWKIRNREKVLGTEGPVKYGPPSSKPPKIKKPPAPTSKIRRRK